MLNFSCHSAASLNRPVWVQLYLFSSTTDSPTFPIHPIPHRLLPSPTSQFISGSIQKNMLADFLPVLRLYDLLYPEMEPIPVPDINHCRSATSMAITCIWIHLQRKAQVSRRWFCTADDPICYFQKFWIKKSKRIKLTKKCYPRRDSNPQSLN